MEPFSKRLTLNKLMRSFLCGLWQGFGVVLAENFLTATTLADYYSQMNRKIILRSIEVTSSRSSLAGGFALTPRRLIFASVRDGLKAENAHNEPIMSAFHPKANDGERKRKLHRPSKVAQLVPIPEVGCPVQSLRWRGRTLSLAL